MFLRLVTLEHWLRCTVFRRIRRSARVYIALAANTLDESEPVAWEFAMDKNATNWNYEVWFGPSSDWVRYFGEYTFLVDCIFENAKSATVSVISRPQLFLIRHAIELGYKANIIELEKLSGLSSQLNFKGAKAHSLQGLHQDFDRHFQEVAKKYDLTQEVTLEYDKLYGVLSKLKNVFQELDELSYALRYPVKNDGKTPSIEKTIKLNMMEVYRLYETAKIFLKYTTNVVMEFAPENYKEA
ncbi:hypothetical protein AZOA_12920 [Azoarcus sp. Aa7]|nr:hypothetical protein [Azoarcus sp. Aa7]